MRPHDILTDEQKKNTQPPPPLPPVDNQTLRSIVDQLWSAEKSSLDHPLMNEEEYRARADRMNEYKKITHAHILLLSHYAPSDNPRLHKKAHYHLNEIKLLKKKVEFSYELLTLFKKPTPPFNYYLASIVSDTLFWQGVDELIDAYLEEDSMVNKKNNPTPTLAH